MKNSIQISIENLGDQAMYSRVRMLVGTATYEVVNGKQKIQGFPEIRDARNGGHLRKATYDKRASPREWPCVLQP